MKRQLSGAADAGSYGARLARAPVGPRAAYSALPPAADKIGTGQGDPDEDARPTSAAPVVRH
jgi:hypothetical protein